MHLGVLFLLTGFIAATSVANDLHGSEDSDWSPQDQGPQMGAEFNSGASASGGPEVPFVPNDVTNWFEEYALQKAIQDKQDGKNRMDTSEIQDALSPLVVVQMKTVKSSSANSTGVIRAPITNDVNSSVGKSLNGATASVSFTQTVVPNVVVNMPSSSPALTTLEAKADLESESNASDAARRIQAYTKKGLEKKFEGNVGKTSGVFGGAGGLAASWKQFFSNWFSRSLAVSRSGLSRRFEPVESSEIATSEGDEKSRPRFDSQPREISTASSGSVLPELTSSGSWFGWVGWLVAFGLLATLVSLLGRRTRN